MSYQQGYSFPELLISLFLFTFLMMGMFSLFVSTQRFNNEIHQYAMAAHYAHDIIERMRANAAAMEFYQGVFGGEIHAVIDCSTGCTAEQLAAADLAEWQYQLKGSAVINEQQAFPILPEAIACISREAEVVVVVISWRSHILTDQHDYDCGEKNGRLALSRRVYITHFAEDV